MSRRGEERVAVTVRLRMRVRVPGEVRVPGKVRVPGRGSSKKLRARESNRVAGCAPRLEEEELHALKVALELLGVMKDEEARLG